MNDENPTPLQRLGHLRAALEDAEDHLHEGRLTQAAARLADARGIATHLTCRAEETEAAFLPPSAPPGWMAFPERELRAAITKVLIENTALGRVPDYVDNVIRELVSAPRADATATDESPFRPHLRHLDLFEALSRVEALEDAGATLVRELAGKDPAWWVKAADALGVLEDLAVHRNGA